MCTRLVLIGAVALFWTAMTGAAQTAPATRGDRVEVGRLANGATVSLVKGGSGEWRVDMVGGGLSFSQETPVMIEIYRNSTSQWVPAGYGSVQKAGDAVVAKAHVEEGKAAFDVEDTWKVSGAMLAVSRKVSVATAEENVGFLSAIQLTVGVEDAGTCFVPGISYGDPTYDGLAAATQAGRFVLREDTLPAPLVGVYQRDKSWAAVMDLAPRGDTTAAEAGIGGAAGGGRGAGAEAIIDERIQVGALGYSLRPIKMAPPFDLTLSFSMPAMTLGGNNGGRGGAARRMYHPVKAGFVQNYQVGFCLGKSDSFREMERDTWRWAWKNLDPKVKTVDLEVARKVMLDMMSDHVITDGDFTGLPFLIDAVTGHPGSYRTTAPRGPDGRPPESALQDRRGGGKPWNELSLDDAKKLADWAKPKGIDVDPEAHELGLWMKVMSGFVSKGIESADQFLIEGDRDKTARGQKMRQQGLAIINTFVTKVSLGPPNGAGYNIYTQQPVYAPPDTLFLRQMGEDVRTLVDAYAREKKLGRDHPDWLAWVKKGADWLLTQQQPDGSFPRSWNAPDLAIKEASGSGSYNVVPMLVRLSEETGEKKYLDAATRAAEFVWTNYGTKGDYVGGTTDNPNIVDKEAGMLAMEAFVVLYENTRDAKWLDRAKAAGDFTETWMWIWNVPMPVDADPHALQWDKSASTIGSQGISSRGGGGVDEYLAWAVGTYAKLYKYSKDEHDLDVARVLLHGSKAMLALPGRTFDLVGPGWQQEGWRLGPGRGVGWHRSWLPWVSDNHLRGITALEQFDPQLYQQLTK